MGVSRLLAEARPVRSETGGRKVLLSSLGDDSVEPPHFRFPFERGSATRNPTLLFLLCGLLLFRYAARVF